MKKVMMLFVVCLFLGFNALNASADLLITGAYTQQNNASQVMNIGKTSLFAFPFTQTQFFYIHTQHLLVLNADGLFLTSHAGCDKRSDLRTVFFGYRL